MSVYETSKEATNINETPEQREVRLVRRIEQYRPRRSAETADAREARLERQRESAQRRRAMARARNLQTIETPACLKPDAPVPVSFHGNVRGERDSSSAASSRTSAATSG